MKRERGQIMGNLNLWIFGCLLLGIFLGYIGRIIYLKFQVTLSEKTATRILEEATREAETKRKEGFLEVKEEMHRLRAEFEKETRSRRIELSNLEKRLTQKEQNLDKKVDILDRKEREIQSKEKYLYSQERQLQEKEQRIAKQNEEQKKILERLAGMNSEEAKRILLHNMQQEMKHEEAVLVKRMEQEAREIANKKAKEIISLAIQRCAAEFTADITVSTVSLSSDEMKGRIIGREGRNIRAFETATGVDLIIDDTPEAITLSAFDGVRREIARVALERLIADGRIHPARIEEVISKVNKEMEVHLKEVGEQVAFELGIVGLHPELVKLIGRLKYRTSYGQNVLQHSKEVAYIIAVLAAELGVDVTFAKRAGLLHDIGKAVDHEVEGSHPQIGAGLARRYNEGAKMINAILSHHEEGMEPQSVEAVLLQAADTISASRPGVRRESLEHYLRRLEKLEGIANSFQGVEKSYAIQAGRELRIIVEPEDIDDVSAAQLAREVAQKIEHELEYPGQIKITVIREVRAVELAK